MSGRETVLGRVRRALADVPRAETPQQVPVGRDYLGAHSPTDTDTDADIDADSDTDTDIDAAIAMLAERLADYRATVHRVDSAGLPALIGRLLAARGSRRVVVPAGLEPGWLAEAAGVRWVTDAAELTARDLDAADSVVTGCALAIAETGTLVLDGGPDQGRRRITLVPDHHVCVVRVPEQLVVSVPRALERLDPVRPQTWISGPSATSDIELNRVEGVHGPRTLEVVLLTRGR